MIIHNPFASKQKRENRNFVVTKFFMKDLRAKTICNDYMNIISETQYSNVTMFYLKVALHVEIVH